MSQSALEIWTVALIFTTAFIAAGGFGIFYAQKRRAILLSIQQDKVKAHDKELDEREEGRIGADREQGGLAARLVTIVCSSRQKNTTPVIWKGGGR